MSRTKSASEDEDRTDSMVFKIDVVQDIAGQVEEMARLGAFGQFREAREQAEDLFSRQEDIFPVKVECMRLLYD